MKLPASPSASEVASSVTPTSEELAAVFGDDSTGDCPAERARTSRTHFVRSQVQLAFATPEATGMVLTAHQALEAFGYSVLRRVAEDGSAPLMSTSYETADMLRSRREEMHYTQEQLALAAEVTVEEVRKAEAPGRSPMRVLARLATVLGLNPARLSFNHGQPPKD